jgi:predicted chitinase
MQPIHEYGGNNYFFRMYDPQSPLPKRRAVAKALGNTIPGDGVLFHGRGYVQLTGRANYKKMGTAFGVDLVSNAAAADRALDPTIASKIMFRGMEEGTFTGANFAKFFSGPKEDWVNARRIINGLDRANIIAAHSKEFYAAIAYTT